MDTSDPKPRVNFNYLQQYVDKRVLLVGVVEKAAGGNVQIRTSDGGNVTVQTQGAPAYTSSDCVEFDAKVVGPNCVQELGYTRLSSGFGACRCLRLTS